MATHREMSLFEAENEGEKTELAADVLVTRILRQIDIPQPKRPLQCVTYNMPLPHYLEMKEAAKRWCISYSDLLRIGAHLLTPALKDPSEELREMLESHRRAALEKRASRDLKRKGLRRAAMAVPEQGMLD